MSLRPEECRLLMNACRAVGVTWDKGRCDQLGRYQEEIIRQGRHINLVSRGDLKRLVEAHFVDSLRPLPYLPSGENVRLLDLGSGAGFPGLVIKIFRPEIDALLVESNRKKRAFLGHVARTLKLTGLRTLGVRSEEIAADPEYAGRFGAVVARAVGNLSQVLFQAAPFLACGGVIITFKPSQAGRELEEARGAASSLGLQAPEVARERGFAARGSLVLIRRPQGGGAE